MTEVKPEESKTESVEASQVKPTKVSSADDIKKAIQDALESSELVQSYLSANKSKQKYILAIAAFVIGLAIGFML